MGGGDKADIGELNKADLVVSLNNHWLSQRGRIDICYHSGGNRNWDLLIELENEKEMPLKFAQMPQVHCYDNNFVNFCDRLDIPYELYGRTLFQAARHQRSEYEWTNVFMRHLNTPPFTGVFAVRHLTLLPIKSLFVTGMDFYRDEKTGIIPKMICDWHETESQIRFLRELKQSDNRVIYDSVLNQIVFS